MPNYLQRIHRAQQLMRERKLEALLISSPSDLLYLIGYHFHPSERLTLLVVPQEEKPSIIIPRFEAPRLAEAQDILTVQTWTETDNPLKLLAQLVGAHPPAARMAVSDQMWAGFLVGMLEHLPKANFVNAAQVITPLRMIKDQDELDALERAQHMADEAFEKLCQSKFSERSELSIQQELTALRRALGLADCYGGIVGSGPEHSASPHHITGERIIQKGDAVVMDFGGTYQGYYADITRTVHVGPPSAKFREVYAIVDEANQAAFKAFRPGATCESVDRAARDVIEKAGYGQYFTHRVGHGIGLDGHEPPYLVAGNTLPLQADMTFSNEPASTSPASSAFVLKTWLPSPRTAHATSTARRMS